MTFVNVSRLGESLFLITREMTIEHRTYKKGEVVEFEYALDPKKGTILEITKVEVYSQKSIFIHFIVDTDSVQSA